MGPLVLIISNKCSFQSTLNNRSMCQIGTSEEKNMSPNNDNHQYTDELITRNNDIKYFVDLYTATLHLRQRMKEEKLIHSSYSAYFNDENNNNNNFYSIFHNCFHSHEILNWLIKKQLCKTILDGFQIFQVLEKLKIIHHVCDLNDFEYPMYSSGHNNVKYLYRFRLDDGTADQNQSFQQYASIYETYTSLFTLDKSQCRDIDLQETNNSSNCYEQQSGFVLKGDNLARMLALRSNMNIEHLVNNMIIYGLVRFGECDQSIDCNCSQKFRNDEYHQYILNDSYRLKCEQRLDLTALIHNHMNNIQQMDSNNNLRISSNDNSILIDDIEHLFDEYRRKKSSNFNSPTNFDHRSTSEQNGKRKLSWCWKSYSLKRNRRGYGLILQGQGPSYVDRLDPYGSAFHSGIRLNEYIYAIEGINVLRHTGKEIERLLSTFDKCTIYTIYNRDDFSQISTSSNECQHAKENFYSLKSSSSTTTPFNDYSNQIQMINNHHSLNSIVDHQQTFSSYSTSPSSSSIDGCSSCSISPKHLQQYTNNRRGALTKHFQFFRLTSRSYSNALK